MQEKKIIDECFYVSKTRWGTWCSFDLQDNKIVTSLSEEQCIAATKFYLKGKQDGWGETSKTYEGIVGGKL